MSTTEDWLKKSGKTWIYNREIDAANQGKSLWTKVRLEISDWLFYWAMMTVPVEDPLWDDINSAWKQYNRKRHSRNIVNKGDIRPGEVEVEIEAQETWMATARSWYRDGGMGKFNLAYSKTSAIYCLIIGMLFVAGSALDFHYDLVTISALCVGFGLIGCATWTLWLSKRLPHLSIPNPAIYGRTTPRSAALIDASRCWGVIAAAWLIAEWLVPVWSYEEFPSDQRAFIWYAAFAVMGVAFGAAIYFGRKAKGPADYRLLGRAVIQLAIGCAAIFGATVLGKYIPHLEDVGGLIFVWVTITASAKILMLPWLPSILWLRK